MNDIRQRRRMQPTQVVSLETARQLMNEGIQDPIANKGNVIQGDGMAHMAYNYHLLNKHIK